MKKLILALSFISYFTFTYAQNAEKFFKNKDYQRAVFAYEREVKNDPSLYLNLGKTYFALQKFDQAIEALKLYKEKYSKADVAYVDKFIALLERDDEMVKVENIGPTFNTSANEFLPRILADGKTLYFLSNRSGGSGGEDIYYSSMDKNGNWSSPKQLYDLNSSSNEGILAISPDEKVAIVFGNYKGSFGGGDLFYSVKTENGWTPPCNIGGTINTKRWESLACIGSDGKTLIYSTDLGNGNSSDLYITFLSEDGWSKPISLGSTINTKEDEKYPFLSADGKTLYFSSNGHFGFGDKDLFMSRRLDDSWTKWSEPINLGKYINTLESDADLSIPGSGNMAYVVRTDAPDGYGGNDIYKFLIPYSMRPEQLFKVYGYVTNEKDSAAEVNIRFVDMATNKEVTKATSNAETGYYSTSLPLNKKYMAIIDMKGFLYYSEIIDLTNPDKYRKKYTFQQKIAVQRKRLDELKAQLDKLNVDIGNLNQSNSDQLKVVFDKYELAFKQYNLALEEMENLVYQAKYAWMTENTEDLSLQKDFHVKRAIIGAKFELKNIFFELGSAVLKEDSKKELDKLVEIMKYSEIVIELGGHTDSIGTSEANQKLSQDRVESVKKYLTDKGISQNRMVAVGYGETLPVASNSTPEGRQLNRRVEVKILKLQADKEGTDVVTEEDKKKKDKKEVAPVAKKGEMLPILQAAARKGGLPSGSDCNSEVYVPKYTNTNYKGTNTKNNNNKYGKGSYFDKDRLSIKENIYKQFNLSLMNHRYKSMGMSTGASMILLNKKKLNEHHLEYYFGNPNNVKWGAGYTGLKMWQLKEKTGLPMNIFAGLDLKYFENDGGASQKEDDNFYHLNVPVGARLIFPVKQIIFAPEFQYSFMLARNKKEPFGEPFMDNTSFMKFGAMARWKFLHAGLHVNLGKEISFLGYRLGVSF